MSERWRSELGKIDQLEPPSRLLDEARAFSPRTPTGPSGRSRILAGAVAFVVFGAAVAFFARAFTSNPDSVPASPGPVAVQNGPIWVQVGGGEAGTAIYNIAPDMKRPPVAMWTDSRSFGGAEVAPELLADDYAFSPNGSEVVFSQQTHQGGSDTPRELFVMNADGTGVTQLTHDGAYAGFPAWSPDGTTIAYASYQGSNYIPGCLGLSICPTDLYLIDAAGGTPRQFATDPDLSETTPSWSPDGSRLAFAETGQGGTGSIVNVAVDGSDRVELSPTGSVSFPSWSPDGNWIAFLLGQDGTNLLVSATPSDLGHHVITDTHTDTNFGRPVWSPDGTLIAYARPFAGTTSLWTIAATGDRSPERVAGFPGYDASPLAWQPIFQPPVSSPPGDGSSASTSPPSSSGLDRVAVYEALVRYLVASPDTEGDFHDTIHVNPSLCSIIDKPNCDRLTEDEQQELRSRLEDLGTVVFRDHFDTEGGSSTILLGPISTEGDGIRVEGGSICGGLCGSGGTYIVEPMTSGYISYIVTGLDESQGRWVA